MFEPKFKVQDIVCFTLTGQKAMVLSVIKNEPGNVYTSPIDGYLIRLDNYQELPVREFEITLVEEYKGNAS